MPTLSCDVCESRCQVHFGVGCLVHCGDCGHRFLVPPLKMARLYHVIQRAVYLERHGPRRCRSQENTDCTNPRIPNRGKQQVAHAS